MMRDTALLLRLYWRIDRRDRGGLPVAARAAYYLTGLAFAAFSGFLGYFAGQLVTAPGTPFALAEGLVPGLLFTLLLLGLLFTGFNQALAALFLSGDLERLLVAPVDSKAVMTAKLLGRLPSMTIILLALSAPALLTYGIGTGMGASYYAGGTVLLLVSPLFGLSVGALIAMLLVRVLPPRRLKEHLGAVYIVLGMLLAVGIQVPRLMGDGEQIDPQSAQALAGVFDTIGQLPLPSMWAGRGLVELGHGQVSLALGGIAVYLMITVGLFAVTALLADRLYLSGWLRMQSSGMARRGFEEGAGLFGSSSLDATLAFKDWLLRLRDSRQVATLFSGVLVAAFFAFIVLRPNRDDGLLSLSQSAGAFPGPAWFSALVSPGVIVSGVVLFAGWGMFNRAAINALALEGRAFNVLKAAPVSARQVLASKILGVVVPYSIVVSLLLVAGRFLVAYSLLWMPYAWLCLLIMGYGLLTVSTSIGSIYVRLDWEDPRRMTTQKAGLYNLIGTVTYGLVTGVIALIPYLLAATAPAGTLFYVVLGLLVLLGVTWGLRQWLSRRVEMVWPALGS